MHRYHGSVTWDAVQSDDGIVITPCVVDLPPEGPSQITPEAAFEAAKILDSSIERRVGALGQFFHC